MFPFDYSASQSMSRDTGMQPGEEEGQVRDETNIIIRFFGRLVYLL